MESLASQLPARQAAPLPLPELLPEHCPSCCPSAGRKTLDAESLLCAAPLCEPPALLADYPLLAPGSCRLHLPRADRLLTALPFGEASEPPPSSFKSLANASRARKGAPRFSLLCVLRWCGGLGF